MSEREAFEHAYHYFAQALEVLTSDPKTQCEKGGNYNVAWELKNDVSDVVPHHTTRITLLLKYGLRGQKTEIKR